MGCGHFITKATWPCKTSMDDQLHEAKDPSWIVPKQRGFLNVLEVMATTSLIRPSLPVGYCAPLWQRIPYNETVYQWHPFACKSLAIAICLTTWHELGKYIRSWSHLFKMYILPTLHLYHIIFISYLVMIYSINPSIIEYVFGKSTDIYVC